MAVAKLWARGIGVTSTQVVTGRQLPLVTAPAWELGEDWLRAMGPHLPRLTVAAQKSWTDRECCRCNWLWEESEMGLQGKTGAGILTQTWQPFGLSFWDHTSFQGPCGIRRLFRDHAALAEWGPRSFASAPFLPCGWCWEPESRTSKSFLRYGTPDWAEGKGRTVCVCGYSKEL